MVRKIGSIIFFVAFAFILQIIHISHLYADDEAEAEFIVEGTVAVEDSIQQAPEAIPHSLAFPEQPILKENPDAVILQLAQEYPSNSDLGKGDVEWPTVILPEVADADALPKEPLDPAEEVSYYMTNGGGQNTSPDIQPLAAIEPKDFSALEAPVRNIEVPFEKPPANEGDEFVQVEAPQPTQVPPVVVPTDVTTEGSTDDLTLTDVTSNLLAQDPLETVKEPGEEEEWRSLQETESNHRLVEELKHESMDLTSDFYRSANEELITAIKDRDNPLHEAASNIGPDANLQLHAFMAESQLGLERPDFMRTVMELPNQEKLNVFWANVMASDLPNFPKFPAFHSPRDSSIVVNIGERDPLGTLGVAYSLDQEMTKGNDSFPWRKDFLNQEFGDLSFGDRFAGLTLEMLYHEAVHEFQKDKIPQMWSEHESLPRAQKSQNRYLSHSEIDDTGILDEVGAYLGQLFYSETPKYVLDNFSYFRRPDSGYPKLYQDTGLAVQRLLLGELGYPDYLAEKTMGESISEGYYPSQEEEGALRRQLKESFTPNGSYRDYMGEDHFEDINAFLRTIPTDKIQDSSARLYESIFHQPLLPRRLVDSQHKVLGEAVKELWHKD